MVKTRRLFTTLFFLTCSSIFIFVFTTHHHFEKTNQLSIKCTSSNTSASELITHPRFYHTITSTTTLQSKIRRSNSTFQLDSTEDNFCEENSTFILAIVPSAVGNTNQRNYVRETWAKDDLYPFTKIKTVFVLAATTNNSIQKRVEEEASRFKDIIQTNVIDAYRNLTYKTIASLKWVSENCKHVPWILKIDEDVVVNPFNLRKFLEYEIKRNSRSELIYGRLRKHSKAWRKGKWNVTLEEYPKTYYPPFILGSAYIIARRAVDKLVAYTKITPFFWLEDVYITGLVAEKAGIARKSIEYEYFQTRSSVKLYRGKALFFVGASPRKNMLIWAQIAKLKPTRYEAFKSRQHINL